MAYNDVFNINTMTKISASDLSGKEKSGRHRNGWSNAFTFPWEVGMMYDFKVGGEIQRPMGCNGLDELFETLD